MLYNGKEVPEMIAGLIDKINKNDKKISKTDFYKSLYKLRVNKKSKEFIDNLCHMYTGFEKMKFDEKLKIVISTLIKDIDIDNIGYEDGYEPTLGGWDKRKKASNEKQTMKQPVDKNNDNFVNNSLMISYDENYFIQNISANDSIYFTYFNIDGDYMLIFYNENKQIIFVSMTGGEVKIHKLKDFFMDKYKCNLIVDVFPFDLYEKLSDNKVLDNGGLKYFYLISSNKHYFYY